MGGDLKARNLTQYILYGAVGSIDTPKEKKVSFIRTPMSIQGRFERKETNVMHWKSEVI